MSSMSEGFQQNFKTKLFKESSSFCIESLLSTNNHENDRKPSDVEKSPAINGIFMKDQLIFIYSLTPSQARPCFRSCCPASPRPARSPWPRPPTPPPCCPLVTSSTSSSRRCSPPSRRWARAPWTSTPRARAPGL